MKLLILCDRIPPENAGGAEKVAWGLARGLHQAGHEVHVAAATEKAAFEEMREGIPTYHIHVRYPARLNSYLSLYNPQAQRPLYALYKRIRPDVVSAFNIHSALTYSSLLLAHRMGIATTLTLQDVMAFSITKLTHFIDPTICGAPDADSYRLPPLYNLRAGRLRYNPLRNTVIRSIVRHSVDRRIAGSHALRQALAANDLHNFQVIHAGVAPEDFAASPETIETVRERLGLTGRRVILFAGRLTAAKGSHQMLAALERIREQVPNVTLLMLTRASLADQGLDDPQYRHLMPHVMSGGWLAGEALAAAYQLADVVAAPSICLDVFPTVNLEAMAAGKPVIATCYGGSSEAVIDGETGYIVNPFDTAQFADRLTRILTDEALARSLGAKGREHLLAHFTPDHYADAMLAVYRSIVRRPAQQ